MVEVKKVGSERLRPRWKKKGRPFRRPIIVATPRVLGRHSEMKDLAFACGMGTDI